MVAGLLLLVGCLTLWVDQGVAEAGKKRRTEALDGLRQRSASERWKELQQAWRPIPEAPAVREDEAQHESIEEHTVPPAASGTADDSLWRRAGTRQLDTSASPLPSPSAESTGPRFDDVSQPVWTIDEQVIEGAADVKRTAEPTAVTAGQSADRLALDAINEARPKPITSILPYYDYSPDGEDPCSFLCPTPAGCPENASAKPCPALVELPEVPFESRGFAESHVTWEATNLFSNPLYFEDAALERYGHTHHELVQPLVSLGKFGVQLVGLPYQMALHPVHERRYALGWYRPGECAPYKYYLPPWNAKAAVTAGAVYTGLFYLVP